MRYDCADPSPDDVMDWTEGQPCNQCGTPLMPMVHQFEGNGRRWAYRAPLYHNAEKRVGFCGPHCVMEWCKKDYVRISDEASP